MRKPTSREEILPGFVRFNIGIEGVVDIWCDIEQALESSAPSLPQF